MLNIKNVLQNLIEFKNNHIHLHQEGKAFVRNLLIWLLIINGILYFLDINDYIFGIINFLSIVSFGIVLYFFRNPRREIVEPSENIVYAPADGKVVVVEEVIDTEYFNEPRIQVSIFMSPLNVHVNRVPISGEVKYFKYHDGQYLVAWHPKSSAHNERTTVVIKTLQGIEILIRQIAGAVARRVVCYAEVGKNMKQGEDLGFIKFGSRVDILLPLNAEIKVNIGDKALGNKSIIAYLK
ncbi:MAG TPA: phosphatidylserine decarboxylase family protein [Bacteroidales bacterium]|nr:phosphatidylserine decarboxylase family protein [Bacteroidales bacterium]HPO64583.1 phosphatidylserine decarboxylase family protein [Bacteroidales bacterium]